MYVDSVTIVAVGRNYENGMYITKNLGETWSSPIPLAWCSSVQFISADTGFVGCTGGIYRTFDGGLSWHSLFFHPNSSVASLLFFKADYGFFVDIQQPWLFKWENGARHSVKDSVYSGDVGLNFTAGGMQRENDSIGYLLGNSKGLPPPYFNQTIWKTSDKGESWDTLSGRFYTFSGYFMANTMVGYAISQSSGSGKMYKTTDGGINWQYLFTPMEPIWGESGLPSGYHQQLYFVNQDTGFLSMYYHTYRTRDGGLTWEEMLIEGLDTLNLEPTPEHGWQRRVHCLDEMNCALTGGLMIGGKIRLAVYITSNGGGEGKPVGMPVAAPNLESLLVYPSPASTQVTINGLVGYSGSYLYISDLTGRVTAHQKIAESAITFQVHNWPPGIYFASVRSTEGIIATGKFVVQ